MSKKEKLKERRKCVKKLLRNGVTSPSEIKKHLRNVDHISATKWAVIRDIKVMKTELEKELKYEREIKKKKELKEKLRKQKNDNIKFRGYKSKEFKPIKPYTEREPQKQLQEKKENSLKTTKCKCGRIFKLKPQSNHSVLCMQCGCQYDRINKKWIQIYG